MPSSVTLTHDATAAVVPTQSSLVIVNMLNVTKLSSTTYLTWSLQVKSLLKGYALPKFIDDSSSPPSLIVTTAAVKASNPEYDLWIHEDSLLNSALIGSIEMAHQTLIATATSCLKAWQALALTYGKPSRDHIKQLKNQLKQSIKGTRSVDDYMQLIKSKADSLALLGSTINGKDLTDIVLEGLGDDFKSVIESI